VIIFDELSIFVFWCFNFSCRYLNCHPLAIPKAIARTRWKMTH